MVTGSRRRSSCAEKGEQCAGPCALGDIAAAVGKVQQEEDAGDIQENAMFNAGGLTRRPTFSLFNPSVFVESCH